MSVKAIAWVLDDLQALKPGPTLVMLALADFADERNSCFPGQGRIAARARCSRRTVIRYLAELQNLGLIEVETRTANDPDGKVRRTSNRYILNVGTIMRTESDKLAHSAKPAGHTESDKLAPSVTESDKMPTECDSSVTGSPRSRSISKTPSLHPSRDESQDVGAAAPRGAAPSGAAGEDSPKVDSHGLDGAVSDSNAKDVITPMEGEKTAQMDTQSRTEGPVVSSEDRQLLADSLPEPMQAIPPRDCARVAADIRERLEAGWSCATVRAALAARALPVQVKTLTGLVRARLRSDVPVDTPPISATSTRPQVLRTSAGDVVDRRDVDAGMMTIAYRQAQANGECPEEMGKWEWAQAVGIENFL